MPHLKSLSNLFPSTIENSFDKNELAFLALTSKIEGPLGDKIAWHLINKIGAKSVLGRGWNKARHDLVIMNKENQKLQSIIEYQSIRKPEI